MKNVAVKTSDGAIQISELIGATVAISGRSIEDVTEMMHQDCLYPTQSGRYIIHLQYSYWRVGDWFDDALKHLLIYNRLSKVIIVEDR